MPVKSRLSRRLFDREGGVLYLPHMSLSTTRDLWFLVASICLVGVSGFVMWALYELAHLGRQTNELVQETRKKLSLLEGAVDGLTAQISSVSTMVGSVSSLVTGLFGFFQRPSRRRSLQDEVRRLRDELDELEEDV